MLRDAQAQLIDFMKFKEALEIADAQIEGYLISNSNYGNCPYFTGKYGMFA